MTSSERAANTTSTFSLRLSVDWTWNAIQIGMRTSNRPVKPLTASKYVKNTVCVNQSVLHSVRYGCKTNAINASVVLNAPWIRKLTLKGHDELGAYCPSNNNDRNRNEQATQKWNRRYEMQQEERGEFREAKSGNVEELRYITQLCLCELEAPALTGISQITHLHDSYELCVRQTVQRLAKSVCRLHGHHRRLRDEQKLRRAEMSIPIYRMSEQQSGATTKRTKATGTR